MALTPVHPVPLRGGPRPRQADGRAHQPAVRRRVRRVRRAGDDHAAQDPRVGGVNDRQIHLIGPVTYSQLTLKRGMTSNLQLWQWFGAGTSPAPCSPPTGDHPVGPRRHPGHPVHPDRAACRSGCARRPQRPGRAGRDRGAGPGLRPSSRSALPGRRLRALAQRRRGSGHDGQRVGRLLRRGVGWLLGRGLAGRGDLGLTASAQPGHGTATITEWDMAARRGGRGSPGRADRRLRPEEPVATYTTDRNPAASPRAAAGGEQDPAQQTGQSDHAVADLLFDTPRTDLGPEEDRPAGVADPARPAARAGPARCSGSAGASFLFFGSCELARARPSTSSPRPACRCGPR